MADQTDDSERSEDLGEDSGADMGQVTSDVEELDSGIPFDTLAYLDESLSKASNGSIPLDALRECLQGVEEVIGHAR